jgi:hypothetical protein
MGWIDRADLPRLGSGRGGGSGVVVFGVDVFDVVDVVGFGVVGCVPGAVAGWAA